MLHNAITWRHNRRWSTSEVGHANEQVLWLVWPPPFEGKPQDQPVLAMLSQVSRRQLSAHQHHHDELLRRRRRIAQAKMRVDVQAGAGDPPGGLRDFVAARLPPLLSRCHQCLSDVTLVSFVHLPMWPRLEDACSFRDDGYIRCLCLLFSSQLTTTTSSINNNKLKPQNHKLPSTCLTLCK